MADQEHAGAGFLAQAHDQAGAFPDLADTAGGAGHFRPVHGLDTVDDRCVRLQLPDLFLDGVQGVFRQHIQIAFDAQPGGAQLDLTRRFLAADIQRALSAFCQMIAYLQEQGAFANAGITADEDQAALDDAAAQNPVQLTDAGSCPDGSILRNILQGHGLRAGAGPLVCGDLSGSLFRNGLKAFLQGVPGAAAGAAANPAGAFIAARGTGICALDLSHDLTSLNNTSIISQKDRPYKACPFV